MSDLAARCVYYVARELARREMVRRKSNDPALWDKLAKESLDIAQDKINTMRNIEVIALIGAVLEQEK